jgi:hypothetical protein
MKSAVAFFIYKRPECTRRVWAEICKAKPPVLLIVADGPRDADDYVKCESTRGLVSGVDWPCDVRRNYASVNMGCRDRMASGLDWVFGQVEEAVILEDDCLPAQSFFAFCDELLAYYRHDARVMHISGNNYQRGHDCGPWSYYFSKYSFSWGWATWRRAWRYNDLGITTWPIVKTCGLLGSVCNGRNERQFWTRVFERQFKGASKAWDYSWTYACLTQHGLCVVPKINLVSNIGLGTDATHTQEGLWFMNLPVSEIHTIIHPPVALINLQADRRNYKDIYQPKWGDSLKETLFNPWMYSGLVRRIPVMGKLWDKFSRLWKR